MPYAAERSSYLYYDERCGSCRTLARAAHRLGGKGIDVVPIVSAEGGAALADLPVAERGAYAHFTDAGARYTGGALVGPLLSALVRARSTPLARLVRRLDPVWDGTYRLLWRLHRTRH
jgi:predicted DCC family thiol-disulfide oxidoreductase YuxK